MPQSYCNLLYHIVFSTKHRARVFVDDMPRCLYEYLGGAIRNEAGVMLAIGGTADHVHLFVRLRQDKPLSGILSAIKANSSGWVHRIYPDLNNFAWQGGYGAFTVSPSQAQKVTTYIERQEEHHQRQSFRDELVVLLRAHGFDPEEGFLRDE